MKQYKELCQRILKDGLKTSDRTGTGTLSVFGHQSVYSMNDGFPMLTLKKVFWKTVVHELLWFISGNTNIKYLLDNNVNIWNEWTLAYKNGYNGFTKLDAVKEAYKDGKYELLELGPVYGKQWRDWNGVDQFSDLLSEAIKNPFSRRLIVSAWNPLEVPSMALPPCHTLWQVKLTPKDETNTDFYIDLQLYQRSADVLLGVPTNIASYSLLLNLISGHINTYAAFKTTPRNFVHSFGDAHIYSNHIDQINETLAREEYPLPKLKYIDKDIFSVKFEDVELVDYVCHSAIKAPIAV